jgi:hypothetical protein
MSRNRGRSITYLDPSEAVDAIDGKDQPAPWEIPTPVSLRRLAREKSQRPAREPSPRPALGRQDPRRPGASHPPAPPVRGPEQIQAEAQRLHDAGLVRSAAENQAQKMGLDRRRPRTPAWLPPEYDDGS